MIEKLRTTDRALSEIETTKLLADCYPEYRREHGIYWPALCDLTIGFNGFDVQNVVSLA